MKTISDYTIYCTEAQTKKALELGAPIDKARVIDTIEGRSIRIPENYGDFYLIPTAEQMLGWLRTKGFAFNTTDYHDYVFWSVSNIQNKKWHMHKYKLQDITEATLAAIDAALEYLIKNKTSIKQV